MTVVQRHLPRPGLPVPVQQAVGQQRRLDTDDAKRRRLQRFDEPTGVPDGDNVLYPRPFVPAADEFNDAGLADFWIGEPEFPFGADIIDKG